MKKRQVFATEASAVSVRVVYDRKKTATAVTPALVQVELRTGRVKKYFTTGVRVYPRQWDAPAAQVRGSLQDDFLNEKIKGTVNAVLEAVERVRRTGSTVTPERVSDALKRAQGGSQDSFIDYVIEKARRPTIQESTRRSQMKLVGSLRRFGRITSFADLTREAVKGYDEFLHTQGYVQTTVYSYHKFLKVYANFAEADGLIRENPYRFLHFDRGRSALRKYLTEEELDRIKGCEVPDGSIANVRDLFLLQCYTGLSYSDLAKTDFTRMERHGGRYVLRDKREKTDTGYYIVIIAPALEILKRHSFRIRVMTNQQYNLRLKVLASYAGIDRRLTSHMARHTFAVSCLRAGVPIESLSRMLGHTDVQTTQIYAKVLDVSVESGFDRLERSVRKD